MPSPRLTDVAGAAVYTGRTEQAIRSMTKRRQIPFVKIGRRLMFDLRKLDRWIDAQSVEAK